MQDQADKASAMKQQGQDKSQDAIPAGARAPGAQRVIAVCSGKGGVGKSSFTVNFGIALTRFGHRVLLLDADLGMGNLDLLLGMTPKYNISHILAGKKEISDVVLSGPSGVKVLPASSGGKRTAKVDFEIKKQLVQDMRAHTDLADTVFLDINAGLDDNVIHFLKLADEVIIMTTPEPTAIMDSYGIVKMLAQERDETTLHLLVNMATDKYDAQHVGNTMEMVTKQFMNVTLTEMGWVYYDPLVSRSVRQQQPFVLLYPASRAARSIADIAARFADSEVDFMVERGLRGWIQKVRGLFT